MTAQFQLHSSALPQGASAGLAHSHDHSHSGDHGHTHEHMDHPGSYLARDTPRTNRNWSERGFTTALMLALCQRLHPKFNIGAVTNDIFTQEDAEFLIRHNALPQERIRAVETGEDISANIAACESLQHAFGTEILLVESGGDNLAANYSRELADYIIYVIDVSGGDKIPRKGGPGITESDLLIVNKTDLAPMIGADLSVMDRLAATRLTHRDSKKMRGPGPTVFAQVKNGEGMDLIVAHILTAFRAATGHHA
ncbi:hypothetical protein HDV03_001373 [Kappamyces sp. JEL0829]|nr:hypothetical protein HDV03_001373 [Kappamyces sp. JEL0829]